MFQTVSVSWRQELNLLLSAMEASRKPALRRSLSPDYLYSTDLPLCASSEICESFRQRASALDWESSPAGSWINLRKTGSLLPSGWWDSLPGEVEAACVIDLLRRHPSLCLSRSQACLLLKAQEEGSSFLEKACRSVHQDLARQLREKGHEENPLVSMHKASAL